MSVLRQPKILKWIEKYGLLPWQIKPFYSMADIVVLPGGAGRGASTLAAKKVHRHCSLYPGTVALAMRKVEHLCKDSVRANLLKESGAHENRRGAGDCWPVQGGIDYKNGSIIRYAGVNGPEQREALRSKGSVSNPGVVDIIWMEEATQFSYLDFQEIQARLRGNAAPYRQLILSTNPDSPYHWIYQQLVLRNLPGVNIDIYPATFLDNPLLPADYEKKRLDTLGQTMLARMKRGLWVESSGLVYPAWSSEKNIVESIPDGWQEWPRVCGVDWGMREPAVCLWSAIEPSTGTIYVYREIYESGLIDTEFTKMIASYPDSKSRNLRMMCDPSNPSRIADLRRRGVNALGGNNKRMVGIGKVQSYIDSESSGRRLFYLRSALVKEDLKRRPSPTSLVSEITMYQNKTDKLTGEILDSPIDSNDHAMDALRYLVMQANKQFPI
jgi:phage terminase large subunit